LARVQKRLRGRIPKKAMVIVPSLEEYERKIVPVPVAVNQ
jgi:hypothetical protein